MPVDLCYWLLHEYVSLIASFKINPKSLKLLERAIKYDNPWSQDLIKLHDNISILHTHTTKL